VFESKDLTNLMGMENLLNDGVSNGDCLPIESEELGTHPRHSLDKEAGLPACRVCQCSESDKRGDVALGFLGIISPLQEASKSYGEVKPGSKEVFKDVESRLSLKKNAGREAGLVEFISPDGEVFICNTDLEMGSCYHHDTLVELGCSCKNDLALVHYACALKWFVNHGSTVCEICGQEYEALRERTASGEPNPALVHTSTGVDPDAVAAIRRQRLIEISLWFNPHNNINYNISAAVSQVVSEQPVNTVSEDVVPDENPATKWAVEGTGILLATGLLTVTLAWLIAPRVGKVSLIKCSFCLLRIQCTQGTLQSHGNSIYRVISSSYV